MSVELDRSIREWLDQEGADGGQHAEAAFARAMGSLPRLSPRAGFADRALLRAGVVACSSPSWWPMTVHLALATCLLVAGLALANLPVLVSAWAPIARVLFLSLIVPALTGLARVMAAAFESWTCLERIASALRASLTSSTVVLLLALNLLVAAASLAGLKRLLRTPEEWLPW